MFYTNLQKGKAVEYRKMFVLMGLRLASGIELITGPSIANKRSSLYFVSVAQAMVVYLAENLI